MLDEEDILEMKEVFDLFDTDGSEAIDFMELKKFMQGLGYDASSKIVAELLAGLDQNANKTLEFPEFLELMLSRVQSKENREEFEKVFQLFDSESKGTITFANLKRFALELGDEIQDEELMDMIERADSNGDGAVTMDDFYNFMTKRTYR